MLSSPYLVGIFAKTETETGELRIQKACSRNELAATKTNAG